MQKKILANAQSSKTEVIDSKIFYNAKIKALILQEIQKQQKDATIINPQFKPVQTLNIYKDLINEAKIKNAIQKLMTTIKASLSKEQEEIKLALIDGLEDLLSPVVDLLNIDDPQADKLLESLTNSIMEDLKKEKNAKDLIDVISQKVSSLINSLDANKAKIFYSALPPLTEKQTNDIIYSQFKPIFQSYDIRGTVEKHVLSNKTMPMQLDKDIAERIGYALGTNTFKLPTGEYGLKPSDTFVIGYDNGISSPDLAKGLAEGLRNAGIHVIMLHQGSTGEIYEAVPRFGTAGGIMITRSHTEKVQNGIKMVMGKECLSSDNCNDGNSDNIAKIRDAVWNRTTGGPVKKGALVDLPQISTRLSKQLFKQSLIDEYKEVLKKGKSPVAINYDGGTATIYTDMFEKVLPEKRLVKEFRAVSDPDAQEGLPDPSQARYMTKMIEWAKKNPGIPVFSYDLDADRVAMIEGTKLGEAKLYLGDEMVYPLADHFLGIFLPNFIEKNKNIVIENLKNQDKEIPADIEKYMWERLNTILVDPRCSLNVKRLIETLGGKFQPQRIGHSHVKASMNKLIATAAKDFGFKTPEEFIAKTGFKMPQIEYSLHVFLTNNKGIPVDCAIRASLELIKILDELAIHYKKETLNLTEHIEELKKKGIVLKTLKTPEMRSWYTSINPTKHEFVYKVFDYLKDQLKDKPEMVFTDIKDGFTINTPKGSVMFRYSNTSPKVTSVIETLGDEKSSAQDNYCELLKIIMQAYNKFGGEPIDYKENPFLKEDWIQSRLGKLEDLK